MERADHRMGHRCNRVDRPCNRMALRFMNDGAGVTSGARWGKAGAPLFTSPERWFRPATAGFTAGAFHFHTVSRPACRDRTKCNRARLAVIFPPGNLFPTAWVCLGQVGK